MTEENKQESDQADYYMENGLVVFTAAFHLKRGYCCKRGCRHCPYPKTSSRFSGNPTPGDENKSQS